jgi:VIT1/CCC1 family predicted Fe2+/Mn2+ transporter
MEQDPISKFQSTYMSLGDRLGEWMYGFIMVIVVVGMVGGYSEILLESDLGYVRSYLTVWLVVVTFGVNIAWGIIDGYGVIYGGLTDRADQEELLEKLKKDRNNRELRDRVLDSLEDSSTMYLPDEEKEKLVDRLIDTAPETPVRYSFTKEDRNTLIAIASCDILAVIPVILPYLFLGFGKLPTILSRLIAAIALGYITFLFAEHTGRRKWLTAGCWAILTLVVMAVTYYFGW